MSAKLYQGDAAQIASLFPPNYFTSILTDPPYGLSLMGHGWDYGVPGAEYWRAFLRICKPGAMLLAFGGTRTYHRLACAIEDAGWEIRDCLMWTYGNGMPKSLDISKAFDKAAGAEREVVGESPWKNPKFSPGMGVSGLRQAGSPAGAYAGETVHLPVTAPATDLAKLWDGYGTAIKPAWEPIILAMKPLAGTFLANAREHGVAGLNIEDCRVGSESTEVVRPRNSLGRMNDDNWRWKPGVNGSPNGRWPANLIHDESEEVLALFPDSKIGGSGSGVKLSQNNGAAMCPESREIGTPVVGYNDSGSAARFFYSAKTPPSERHAGCENLFWDMTAAEPRLVSKDEWDRLSTKDRQTGNIHPTVKPLKVSNWLATLLCPPERGLMLDPFCGSGSLLLGGLNGGFPDVVGFDNWGVASEISSARLTHQLAKEILFADYRGIPARIWR